MSFLNHPEHLKRFARRRTVVTLHLLGVRLQSTVLLQSVCITSQIKSARKATVAFYRGQIALLGSWATSIKNLKTPARRITTFQEAISACIPRSNSKMWPGFLDKDNNWCLANWATVVCQKEERSTHWISLYLSYSHLMSDAWGQNLLLISITLKPRELSDTKVYAP